VSLDAGSAEAYLLRGRLRLKQGRTEDALKDLHEGTVLKPEDIEGWLLYEEAQLKASDLKGAADSVQKAAQTDAADWRVPLGEAKTARARRNWDEAIQKLDAADAGAKRRAPEPPTERAICRVAQGKPEEALADYDLAVPLHEKAVLRTARARDKKFE